MKGNYKGQSFRRRLLEDQRRLSEQYGDDSLITLVSELEARGDTAYAKYVRSQIRKHLSAMQEYSSDDGA